MICLKIGYDDKLWVYAIFRQTHPMGMPMLIHGMCCACLGFAGITGVELSLIGCIQRWVLSNGILRRQTTFIGQTCIETEVWDMKSCGFDRNVMSCKGNILIRGFIQNNRKQSTLWWIVGTLSDSKSAPIFFVNFASCISFCLSFPIVLSKKGWTSEESWSLLSRNPRDNLQVKTNGYPPAIKHGWKIHH